MPNYEEKQKIVDEIKEKLQESSGVVLADYRGMTVSQVTKLRVELRQAGIEYRVLKNTMVRRAADEIGLQGLDPYLKGLTAVAFSADPVAPAKILIEFGKKIKSFRLRLVWLKDRSLGRIRLKTWLLFLPERFFLPRYLQECRLLSLALSMSFRVRFAKWFMHWKKCVR